MNKKFIFSCRDCGRHGTFSNQNITICWFCRSHNIEEITPAFQAYLKTTEYAWYALMIILLVLGIIAMASWEGYY